jgi:DNA mismatch endonuclease (patch repair protein)
MTDRISPEHRSWNMSRIRGKDTRPEMLVRSLLHRMGYRFRLHCSALPGKPDIILPKHRIALFVHGCFWHRHGCKFSYTPKTRKEFWKRKFKRNVARHEEVTHDLLALGWHVVTVWECEADHADKLRSRLEELLQPCL